MWQMMKGLVEERRELYEWMKTTLGETTAKGKEMSDDQTAEWDRRDKRVVAIDGEIERIQRLYDLGEKVRTELDPEDRRELEERGELPKRTSGKGPAGEKLSPEQVAERETRAFGQQLRAWAGGPPVDQELRSFVRRANLRDQGLDHAELRALGSGPSPDSGVLIPEGFIRELEKAMLAFNFMRGSGARIFSTATGNDLRLPMRNDTGNTGKIVAEHAPTSPLDPPYADLTYKAFKFTSDHVLMSIEIAQDSAFNMEQELRDVFAERIGRYSNTMFTTGNGTSQPEGIVTNAPSGVTFATNAAITFPELAELQHSIDLSYRSSSAFRFMFNDSTLAYLKKQVDGEGRPLWIPGFDSAEPNRILGTRYVLNNDVSAIGANAKSVVCGDFSKFRIRDVMGMTMFPMREKYIDQGDIAYVMFSRHDSRYVNAGTDPIKVGDHPA